MVDDEITRLRAELGAEREKVAKLIRALSCLNKWLGNDRMNQWIYMENVDFYTDLEIYKEALACVLAEVREVKGEDNG